MLISRGRKKQRLSLVAPLEAAAGRVCGQTSAGTGSFPAAGWWRGDGAPASCLPCPGAGKLGEGRNRDPLVPPGAQFPLRCGWAEGGAGMLVVMGHEHGTGGRKRGWCKPGSTGTARSGQTPTGSEERPGTGWGWLWGFARVGGDAQGSWLCWLHLGTSLCPPALPFSLLEVLAHCGSSRRAVGTSLGSSGADSPCGSSKSGRVGPPPLPPTPGPALRTQRPGRLCRCRALSTRYTRVGRGCAALPGHGIPPHLPAGPGLGPVPLPRAAPRGPGLTPWAQRCWRGQALALSRNRLLLKLHCGEWEEAATPRQPHPAILQVLPGPRGAYATFRGQEGRGCWFSPGLGTAEPVPATTVETSPTPRPGHAASTPRRQETAGKAKSPESGAKIGFISIFIAYKKK